MFFIQTKANNQQSPSYTQVSNPQLRKFYFRLDARTPQEQAKEHAPARFAGMRLSKVPLCKIGQKSDFSFANRRRYIYLHPQSSYGWRKYILCRL